MRVPLAVLGECSHLGLYMSSTRRRNPRLSRKFNSHARCAAQANQVFSRSVVWTFGLFQMIEYNAGCWHPFAEQICCSGSLPESANKEDNCCIPPSCQHHETRPGWRKPE